MPRDVSLPSDPPSDREINEARELEDVFKKEAGEYALLMACLAIIQLWKHASAGGDYRNPLR